MTEKMKPSGFDYLGNIPASWDVKRFKYCVQICNGGEYADIEVEEGGYPVIGSGGEFARASKYCYRGESVLLGRKGTVDKPLYVNDAFWCVDTMFYTKAKQGMIPKFLYYCALCFRFDYYVTATALPSMTQKDLGSEMIAVPPTNEQQAIADFLDIQCAKIDSVIADIEKQIDTLQKYKKSMITEAVTKGLDRSVPMKDSGIEWIGEIPKHWNINKTRYLASLCSGATPSKDVYTYWEGNIPWVSSQEVKSDIITDTSLHISEEAIRSCSTKLMPAGTLVMVVRSGILQHTIPVALLGVPATINQDIKAFVFKPEMIPAYYKYYIQGENDALLNVLIKDKTTVESIDNNLLLSLRVMVPPIQEQKDIVNYLDERCSKIDSIISDKQAQLDAIIQHKKSLIYEYVTGKKRVTEVN